MGVPSAFGGSERARRLHQDRPLPAAEALTHTKDLRQVQTRSAARASSFRMSRHRRGRRNAQRRSPKSES